MVSAAADLSTSSVCYAIHNKMFSSVLNITSHNVNILHVSYQTGPVATGEKS